MEYVLCFCLMVVWLVPIILMLSIASSDGVLPGAPGGIGLSSGQASSGGMQSEALHMGGPKRGFLLQLINIAKVGVAPYVAHLNAYLGIRGRNAKRDHMM